MEERPVQMLGGRGEENGENKNKNKSRISHHQTFTKKVGFLERARGCFGGASDGIFEGGSEERSAEWWSVVAMMEEAGAPSRLYPYCN